ncbi:Uncharacterized protein Adt_02570 [Abeliophyllum distichum]|uniref:Uncharacterized protein n=1 Tax=Abeliophyllum distichum TaxID=126358 RepID=A0ABD1VW95_9LAMI
MLTYPITEVVTTENQTMATMPSPYMNQTMVQMSSFALTQTVAPTSHVTVPFNHGKKLEKFIRLNFKRWQQKILFYLTTLNLALKLNQSEGNIQDVSAIEAWKHSDFLCCNYVINGLTDSLYNVYSTIKMAKELWESLD